MATTVQALKTYYDNLMRADFDHIPSAHQTLLTNLASQVDGGTLTLAAAHDQILDLALNTTSVASLSYNFFTGGIPSEAGFDYLISASGPNSNNLNSAYYQSFNTDNRYINFAVNLGKNGEGAAAFAAAYGALTMREATAKAYAEIFGTTPDAAKLDALLNTQVSNGSGGTFTRQAYFATYGGDGLEGIGTKAAMVGWLLSAAATEDTGKYAQANDAFLADLAADGVANFRSSLVTAYGASDPGTAGATLTVAGDKSISPTAVDPSLRSTANNDTITGTNGLNPVVTVDAGAGHDTINISGTIYGTITTSDGGDTVTVGALGASTPTLGVPAQYGTVTLGGSGGNTVYLNGDMATGTSITAAGTDNVLHINTQIPGVFSGFQTVHLHSLNLGSAGGASVIYDVVSDAKYAGFPVRITAENHQTVVLKDTSNAVVLSVPVAAGASAHIHLQNFTGAPTTDVNQAMGGVYQPNGGAIGLIAYSDGTTTDNNGELTLHVDTDSTAGFVYGYTTNSMFPSAKGVLPNLTIVGSGKLTAQISSNFSNVDATQAGDLDLTYEARTSTTEQTFRLGDGTNKLSIFFGGSLDANLTAASVKFYLGAGADTIALTGTAMPSPTGANLFATTSLGNLHIRGGATVDSPPEIIGFQKGVDHLVLDALAHAATADVQTYADGAASLTAALIAVSAHTAVNSVAVFTWNGDTYVYAQDGTVGVNMGATVNTGDGLIKLVGVTGLTVGTGAGSYDIHYG